jgi:two-component system cell cycle sensor histidine kinase/response regulator CckA
MASSFPDSPAHSPDLSIIDRLIVALVIAAVIASAWLIWVAVGDPRVAAVFGAVFLSVVAVVLLFRLRRTTVAAVEAQPPAESGLLLAAISDNHSATAITDRSGKLVTANSGFESLFGLATPPLLALDGDDADRLATAARSAWRDGDAHVDDLRIDGRGLSVRIERTGLADDHLIWRFSADTASDATERARLIIEGSGGQRLGRSGIMAAVIDGHGQVLSANGAFIERAAAGRNMPIVNRPLTEMLIASEDERLRFIAEGEQADPVRPIEIALTEDPHGNSLFFFLDDKRGAGVDAADHRAAVNLHGLLAMLPLGLALVDRDGRFLFMNDAFRRAAAIGPEERLVYPSDLVVKEDKGAVSDAVRRSAGRAHSGDVSVRLRQRPDDPIALTIAAAKGLGEATVVLSLKDNSEESKLMRQVAQATKMQAVGQLAGGVAHDFNNILTAIIGHCDLMLMRHTPGDSDYDDIQQIKHNSNRAASLTRQLLAFSRQQTLRPQILQLPDVISEISNLLKRLLGETVTLEVKHGRNLGAVRADPGQLEQVIVNLAVNARDAMPNGGTLTIQTYAVSAADVRRLDTDILPPSDYTALRISDTGTGIPKEIIGKIFEPFFTTKEVGKGTGLGLSTVYGIVKQTDGFIFADSTVGKGTSFVIYLPVLHAEAEAAPAKALPKPKVSEAWGTGNVLLVEDEPMVRAVAERALTRQGYQVKTATNGEEAMAILEDIPEGDADQQINLLISDVVMPTMDGPTLGRLARELFPDLPILFMSGYAEEQLRNSIAIDRVAFLPKPFSVQQLAEAARDALASVEKV